MRETVIITMRHVFTMAAPLMTGSPSMRETAATAFRKCLSLTPDDGPAQKMLRRYET